MSDPFEPLSAGALASLLGAVAPSSVRALEDCGSVFSIVPPGHESGRAYPRFQACPDTAGDPMRKILQLLGRPDGGAAWGFFASASPELDGLTPVEVLSGSMFAERSISQVARELLSADLLTRLDAVGGAAQAFAFDR